MAVFISVITSPFEGVFDDAARAGTTQNVRRPFRGLELKKDTYATIKVIDAAGHPILFTDSSAPGTTEEDAEGNIVAMSDIGRSTEYSNFILQSVTEQRVEKQQVVETFGEDYIFFFGERPRIYNFSAILLNTRNFNWKNEWWKNYEEVLRGTKLLERNARMYIYFDDVVIEGYMLQAQAMHTVEDPYKLPLNFQVFCTNYSIIGDVGSIFTPPYSNGVSDWDFANDGPMTAEDVHMFAPPEDNEVLARNAESLFADSGSLTGFLADAARFASDATFSVQRTLEQVRNAFYGRSLTFPNKGVGNQVYVPPIENNAHFPPPPNAGRPVPIFMQKDEYTKFYAEVTLPEYDQRETNRVRNLLRLNGPEELDKRATAHLKELGCSVGRPSAGYLLLGRAAFAGSQVFGSFGLRQADGELSTPGI